MSRQQYHGTHKTRLLYSLNCHLAQLAHKPFIAVDCAIAIAAEQYHKRRCNQELSQQDKSIINNIL